MSPEAQSPFPALPKDFLSPGDFPSLGRSEGGTAGLGMRRELLPLAGN